MTCYYIGSRHYPRGRWWHYSTLLELTVVDNFTHCRLQLELISASDVTWISYTAEDLSKGFVDGYSVGLEVAFSTWHIPFLTLGGWELYLGERAFHCVTRDIHIPFHPLPRRFWDISAQIVDLPMEGADGRLFSDGPSTFDAFHSW